MAVDSVQRVERGTGALSFAAVRPDDAELVAAMQRGDERAFRLFFDIYSPRVYRFALRRLRGDIEAARDVVQFTLVKAVRNLAAYRGEAALFSWLCQICLRQIFDVYRSKQRLSRQLAPLDHEPFDRAAPERVRGPVELEPQQAFDAAESADLIRSVLGALPGRYGDVLEWKYIHGRSVEEIGTLLGTGQLSAQSMLARARNAFRGSFWSLLGPAAMDVLAGSRRS